jgi:PIN domain nuclease of toxin-antitoxin system
VFRKNHCGNSPAIDRTTQRIERIRLGCPSLIGLLLDTRILLRSLLDPAQLSLRVAKALLHDGNQIWILPVSTREIPLLGGKGRLNLWGDGDVHRWIEDILSRNLFREAPLTNEVVRRMHKIDLPHRDPAVRFLAATALSFGLTLGTADANLIRGKGYSVLANQ